MPNADSRIVPNATDSNFRELASRIVGEATAKSVGKPIGFLRYSKSDSTMCTVNPRFLNWRQDSRAAWLSYRVLALLFDLNINTDSVELGITARAAVESAPPLNERACGQIFL